MKARCDFAVIGGGVIGLATALELRRRHPSAAIVVLEKERLCGAHASGRNSGVLHAGFYYSAGSLKARFTREGNAALTAYCASNALPLLRCGKLVVATSDSEAVELRRLYENGIANGVRLEWISADDARRIEPRVTTQYDAIFSPTTSSVDPHAIMDRLAADATRSRIQILRQSAFRSLRGAALITSTGAIDAGVVINAAGLYADTIGHQFGVGSQYSILPFRGNYLLSSEAPDREVRTNIYPVPDRRFPFLGVHFTVTASGRSKIGPTALPVLWREQYAALQNFRPHELIQTLRDLGLFLTDVSVAPFAWSELRKQSRRRLVALASRLARDVRPSDYRRFGGTGIRAQLFNRTTRKLEMDFVVETGKRSVHILNAVSPGFTCAFPFGSYVADLAEGV